MGRSDSDSPYSDGDNREQLLDAGQLVDLPDATSRIESSGSDTKQEDSPSDNKKVIRMDTFLDLEDEERGEEGASGRRREGEEEEETSSLWLEIREIVIAA